MLCRAAGTALLHGQTGPHGMLDLSPPLSNVYARATHTRWAKDHAALTSRNSQSRHQSIGSVA